MKNDKISIIVPIYNVEKYLKRCLDSIINQTYKNMEIILVNDGSKDDSLKICKEYTKKDKRIILIDQENAGLSMARNNGIDKATGDYIGFVDSDDVISLYMYDYLIKSIKESNSDISLCLFKSFNKDIKFSNNYKNISLGKENAIRELLIDRKIPSHANDKLFKKELFNGIRFPKGKKYEDIPVIYKLFLKANNISLVDTELYGYYLRDDSITGNYNIETNKDFIEAVNKRYDELVNINEYSNYAKLNRVNSVLRYYLDIVKFRKKDIFKSDFYKIIYNELLFAKKIYTKDIRKINTRKKNTLIKLLFFNQKLFYYIMCIYSIKNPNI